MDWLAAWLRRTDHASITVIFAFSLTTFMASAALSVDLGLAFANRARLLAATDQAALAAMMNISRADGIVAQSLAATAPGGVGWQAPVLGAYCADANLPEASRFTAGQTVPACANPMGPLPNAVRVTTTAHSPVTFGAAISNLTNLPLSRTSTAIRVDEAGLQMGTSLVSLNAGLVNAVLSSLIGATISLDIGSLSSLNAARIGAADFLRGLTLQLGLDSGNYGQLATRTATMRQVIGAAIGAMQKDASGNAAAITAMQTLSSQAAGTHSVPIACLIETQPWRNEPIGDAIPAVALRALLNVFDVVTYAGQCAASGSGLLTVSASYPGTLGVSVSAIMAPSSGNAFFQFGPVGTVDRAAMLRLQLHLALAGSAALGVASFDLPIYADIASGTATLNAISCATQPATDTIVTVAASGSLVNAWIGTAASSAVADTAHAITAANISPGLLFQSGAARVTGTAVVTSGPGTGTLVFNQSMIAAGQSQTVSGLSVNAGLLQSLLTNVQVGLSTPIVGVTTSGLTAALAPILAAVPIDAIVNQILAAFGVRLGASDVLVTGVRCGVPVIVR